MHYKNNSIYTKYPALVFGVIVIFLMQLIACAPKQARYFQDSGDSSRVKNVERKETVIQKNDILSIVVFSDDPTASAIYNQSVAAAGGSSAGAGTSSNGYLVNELGDIYFQGLGKLHVEGLTKSELINLLDSKLKDQLKNPYYAIRFLNYKITVQGEVNHGGEFNVPNERVTILEAIALAGDMTIYAKRNDVLVVREINGKRETARVDVTSQNIFTSPYYYMQQNDLVIVEATGKKPSAERQERIQDISVAASVIASLAIIIAIFRR